MSSPNTLRFGVSANLQKLIGEELVSNEEMAFIELIKNAYDSGANSVQIGIHMGGGATATHITILDDGEGMNLEDFKRRFMFAAYSERGDEAETAERVPTGEKGIGRFAADRIGAELIVTTRKSGAAKALEVRFDWNKFRNKTRKFNEIDIPYSYVKSPSALGVSGTLLCIRGLRSKWDLQEAESLESALATLLNPFSAPTDFSIDVTAGGARTVTATIAPHKPINPDYELHFKVDNQGVVLRRFKPHGSSKFQDWKQIPGLTAKRLVGVRGRLLYYVKKPSRRLVRGLLPGVQLYRDGFLLQPFGSPISDRLKLVEKRAKRAGHAPLVPNRLFGFVDISRRLHPALKDTTSRQTMLETAELFELVAVLQVQTDFLEENILEEVSKPSWRQSARQQSILLEQAKLNSLGNLSVGIGHEIRQPLQTIMSQADAIELRLEALQIHDQELTVAVEKINQASNRIDKTIQFIKRLSNGDLEEISTFDLAEALRMETKLFESQNEDIGFHLQLPLAQIATINQTTVMQVVSNLLRNSVEAIRDVQDDRHGEISVTLKRVGSTHILKIFDNGIGIAEEIKPKIFKQFATKKTGGLGFGLSYCFTILETHGGKIFFDSTAEAGTTFTVEIPDKGEK